MEHTFLLRPGSWEAGGEYFEPHGSVITVEGEAEIVHQSDRWSNRSWMRLLGESPVMFKNHYDIVPLPAGALATKWTSENLTLGRFLGTLAVVGSALLLQHSSQDGKYQGSETVVQVSPERYRSYGTLFSGQELISSWQVELTRRR